MLIHYPRAPPSHRPHAHPAHACRTLAEQIDPREAADLLQPYTLHKQPQVRSLAVALLESVQARKAEDGLRTQPQEGVGAA